MLYLHGRMVSTAHWREVVSRMMGKLLPRIFLTLNLLESQDRCSSKCTDIYANNILLVRAFINNIVRRSIYCNATLLEIFIILRKLRINGFMQQSSISIANALEILLSCTNPLICMSKYLKHGLPQKLNTLRPREKKMFAIVQKTFSFSFSSIKIIVP